MLILRGFWLLLLLIAAGSTARADIIFSGDFATGSGMVQITSDLTWTVTAPGSVRVIVFDEIVLSDGSGTGVTGSPFLSIESTGGGAAALPFNLVDNTAGSANSLTANDGYFNLTTGVTVASTDAFTLKAATYTFGPVANFNPAYSSGITFTGDTFLTDNNGNLLSNTISASTAVPEPSSAALLAVVGAGYGFYRRRKRCT